MNHTFEYKERLLTIEGLSLSLGGRPILRDINLKVDNIVRTGLQQGQVVAVLGPSGVGKTQLFRCMAGLQTPTAGKVLLNDVRSPVKAGEVGVVFQNYPLMQHRTVLGNLRLASKKPDHELIAQLERFGLADKANLYPAQLSGGQRQRISIIQQLLCSSHFVLMDEPFSGLDILMKQKMIEMILEVSTLNELNTTIVTTHDIESACMIADTIWIMGFQRTEAGDLIPGATIVAEIDLIDRGLAWQADIRHHPNFAKTVDDINTIFTKIT